MKLLSQATLAIIALSVLQGCIVIYVEPEPLRPLKSIDFDLDYNSEFTTCYSTIGGDEITEEVCETHGFIE